MYIKCVYVCVYAPILNSYPICLLILKRAIGLLWKTNWWPSQRYPPHPTPRREINLQPRYLPPLGTEPAVPLVFGKTFQLTEPQSSRNPKVKGGEPQERLYTSPFRPIV